MDLSCFSLGKTGNTNLPLTIRTPSPVCKRSHWASARCTGSLHVTDVGCTHGHVYRSCSKKHVWNFAASTVGAHPGFQKRSRRLDEYKETKAKRAFSNLHCGPTGMPVRSYSFPLCFCLHPFRKAFLISFPWPKERPATLWTMLENVPGFASFNSWLPAIAFAYCHLLKAVDYHWSSKSIPVVCMGQGGVQLSDVGITVETF